MRLLDRLTIRLSWGLVLIALGAIIRGLGEHIGWIAHTATEQHRGLDQSNQAMHQMGIVTERVAEARAVQVPVAQPA